MCPGGNNVIFECTATATGFEVEASTDSVNFGEVKIGTNTSRLLTLTNDSDLPVPF